MGRGKPKGKPAAKDGKRLTPTGRPKAKIKPDTSPTLIMAREFEEQAFDLRKRGHTYREIGIRLGVTKQAAHKAVKRVLEHLATELAEDVPRVRAMELERLDALLEGRWDAAVAGDDSALDRVLRIMERRAKLTGIDAPEKHAVGGVGDFSEKTDEELESIIAGTDEPKEAPEP